MATRSRGQAESPRPLLRGTLHLVAAVLAPFGLVVLVLIADSPRAYVGAAIFASTLIALYTTSASYHVIPWSARFRPILKRLDHSMIFALIAGTYTPLCLIVLPDAWGITLLSIVWSFAGVGMLLKIVWPYAPRWLGVALYMGVGWIALIAIPEIIQHLHWWSLALIILGGLLYSAGGVIYAMRRPDPFPRVFGFHEVFHVFVILGSVVHFVLIAVYVLPS
jgi:hemolysin III